MCAGWSTTLCRATCGPPNSVQAGRVKGGAGGSTGARRASDPAAPYAVSAKAASDVFHRPGALDAPCAVSYGPVPGSVYAGHRLIDVLIHGWDLAIATGQDS